eukprot:299178-Pelagomonas_calceolata.AAC.1
MSQIRKSGAKGPTSYVHNFEPLNLCAEHWCQFSSAYYSSWHQSMSDWLTVLTLLAVKGLELSLSAVILLPFSLLDLSSFSDCRASLTASECVRGEGLLGHT